MINDKRLINNMCEQLKKVKKEDLDYAINEADKVFFEKDKNNIDNNKPIDIDMCIRIVFYKEPSQKYAFGSNDVRYELILEDGILNVNEIGAFGDRTLVAQYNDRRGRGITLDEMLENIKEISEMTYKEFKEKVLKEQLDE